MTTGYLIFFAFLAGVAIGRGLRPLGLQNRSEGLVARTLLDNFAPPDYHLLNHVTLRMSDGTTQIDHILVSRFGVFVVETKSYKGWLFASAGQRFWTQVLFRAKFRFQNPLLQNHRHVVAVRQLLDFLPAESVRSVVVFTGDAEFKAGVPEGVYDLYSLVQHIRQQRREEMSLNRLQFCVGRLETARLAVTRSTDVEHVQSLNRRYGGER